MGTNVGSARYNPRVLPDELSFYLDAANIRSYDGTGSTWYDISSHNRNATLNNSPSFSSSGPSSYFSFDGIDDNLTTTYPITSTPALGNWTYEIWTEITSYPTSLGSPNSFGISYRAGTLFGAMNNAGAALYWYGNNTGTECAVFAIVRGNDSYRSTAGFGMQLNKTYQLTMVNNSSIGFISFFIDGYFFASTAGPTQEYNSGNVSGLNIGMAQPQVDIGGEANYSYYPGRIKNAKIYSRALTAAQVLQNYRALKPRYGV